LTVVVHDGGRRVSESNRSLAERIRKHRRAHQVPVFVERGGGRYERACRKRRFEALVS